MDIFDGSLDLSDLDYVLMADNISDDEPVAEEVRKDEDADDSAIFGMLRGLEVDQTLDIDG